MAGAVYVELTAGPPASEASVDIPHVVETFDTATRDALARTLRGAGGLAGHGEQLNSALRTTPDALTSTTPLLRASRDVATLVAPADRVSRALAAGDLGALAGAANATSEPLAGQADALGASIDAMPGLENRIADVLPIADPVLEDATAAVRELEPAIAALGRALPAARGLEQDSENFADAASLLKTARPVLERARTVVARDVRWAAATLRPISRSAGVLARAIVPYAYELVDAPLGFDRWGGFKYDEGQGKGHKAVRFTMIFTCQTGRDPYPAPGAAIKERERCQP
jgi:ABC-type transporter Mla subunit MlaD